MKINVIGLGYIGLPTAAVLALNGIQVVGVDTNESILHEINNGNINIEEPGLFEAIKDVVVEKMLTTSKEPQPADAFIIAVPTPNSDDEYLSCDLSYVLSAVQSIIPVLKKGDVVICESTIAPGTMEDHIQPLIEKTGLKAGRDIFLAHCPERILPGRLLYELINNDRIIGGITLQSAQKAADVYRMFTKGEITLTDMKTAEMCKLMENTFRDVNIALANEFALVCHQMNVNVLDAIKMANRHPRVNIHSPGPGVGGHCLAVDPYFIYAKSPETARLIKTARDINTGMPAYVADTVKKLVKHNREIKIAALGATYKPDVNDTRLSPALEVIRLLRDDGYHVVVHDPYIRSGVSFGLEEALTGAGLLLCLVGHTAFREMDIQRVTFLMGKQLIFDVTGSLKSEKINIHNFGNIMSLIEPIS